MLLCELLFLLLGWMIEPGGSTIHTSTLIRKRDYQAICNHDNISVGRVTSLPCAVQCRQNQNCLGVNLCYPGAAGSLCTLCVGTEYQLVPAPGCMAYYPDTPGTTKATSTQADTTTEEVATTSPLIVTTSPLITVASGNDCQTNDPCLTNPNQQFHPHAEPTKYIQCAVNTCFEFDCAPGTYWSQAALMCLA